MKRAISLIAIAGAALGASLSLSACDASPYAATVNGHSISQVTLNHQLSEWSSNKAWVRSFDSQNSSANGGSGVTVVGAGGSGTYSSAFAAEILANMVQSEIIAQRLHQTREEPTADEVTASRAVNEYLRSAYWEQFSPSLRQFLVQQLADQAVLTPVSTDTATMQTAFNDIKPYLASQTCVREASAVTQSDAQQIVASGTVGGSEECFSQDHLESQSQTFQTAVEKLNVGDIAQPIKTTYGYTVVQLASRQTPGETPGVKQVLSVVTARTEPVQITRVVNRARVKVNPTYGTWSKGTITPPSLSGS